MPELTGVHHLKLPVTDLDAATSWYGRVFGARRIEHYDHHHTDGTRYAVILDVPGVPTAVELRLAPQVAAAMAGYDPVTFAVADDQALTEWARHLDDCGVEHSPPLEGLIGRLIRFTSPDGLELRLYTGKPAL